MTRADLSPEAPASLRPGYGPGAEQRNVSGRLVTVTVTNVGDALGVGHALAYRLPPRRPACHQLGSNEALGDRT